LHRQNNLIREETEDWSRRLTETAILRDCVGTKSGCSRVGRQRAVEVKGDIGVKLREAQKSIKSYGYLVVSELKYK